MDTTLTKGFISDKYEEDNKAAVAVLKRNNAGDPISQDELPKELYGRRPEEVHKKLPDICLAAGWIVSEPVANVMSQFDLGQGALYPVEVFQHDRVAPVEGKYFHLNFGNTKDAFLPEHSSSAEKPYYNQDIWYLSAIAKDGDIVVRSTALDGADIWVDVRFRYAFFISDRLAQALKTGVLGIPCHFCKLKKRNDTCEKNLILMRLWPLCRMARASPVRMAS